MDDMEFAGVIADIAGTAGGAATLQRLTTVIWILADQLGDEGWSYLREAAARVRAVDHPGDGPAVLGAAGRRVDA